jgi:alpha-ketoglutarate-dependent taurine dioxygenase
MLATETTSPAVVDLASRIGSEIKAGVETLLSGACAAEIRGLLEKRGVVIFRELKLTDLQQVAFAKTLGTVVDEGEKNIYKVTMDTAENRNAEYLKGAFYWHIDGTMLRVPIFASMLSAWRLAPTGGQTEFCNTYAAYDALPESEKKALDPLKVVHSFEVAQRYVNPEPSWTELQAWQKKGTNTLPLVWKHRSGRKSLILGSTAAYVVGMSPEESSALLCRLRDHATQPQFVYRHEWKIGDLVIWDNTGTMHRALPYALDSGRMMHRTQLQGEEPFA